MLQTSESDNSLYDRTRKRVLGASVIISAAIGLATKQKAFNENPNSLLNIQEHGLHVAPGVALGYIMTIGFDVLLPRARHILHQLYAVATVTAGAAAFETPLGDVLWYRNNTHDVYDVVYTAAAAIVGAACLTQTDTPL